MSGADLAAKKAIDRALQLQAFRQGFAAGAAYKKAQRHAVDPLWHDHWREGYEAGMAAALLAQRHYGAELQRRERAS